MNQKYNSIVILANGSYPTHRIPLNYINDEKLIICCDGAADELFKKKIKPYKIIGDLDSISERSKQRYKDIIIFKPNQNHNDLYKTLKWCEKNNYSNITILGASGKREDHTIRNIFLLFDFSNFAYIKMMTDSGVFTLISKRTLFQSYPNQPVSIISINKKVIIKTENLKYPITNNSLNDLYSGTLNSACSNKFVIDVLNGSVLVYQKY